MGLWEGVLIDLLLRLSFLIIPCSQGRMYLSRCTHHHCLSRCSNLSPLCPRGGTGDSENPKTRRGRDGGWGSVWGFIYRGHCCWMKYLPIALILILFFSFVFAVFVVWCRSIWRREKSWHSTRFSTRKLVSLYFWYFTSNKEKCASNPRGSWLKRGWELSHAPVLTRWLLICPELSTTMTENSLSLHNSNAKITSLAPRNKIQNMACPYLFLES